MNTTRKPIDALSVFAFLWASAVIFHHAKWDDWAKSPSHAAVSFAAYWVIFRPRSLPAFVVLVVVQLWNAGERLPLVANHWLFVTFANLAILLSLGLQRAGLGSGSAPARRVADFAPALRAQILLLYAWSFFHKLNADWFRPEVSCATDLYARLVQKFGALPDAAWALDGAIYATLLVELALPVLLLVRSTRLLGILLAVGFHFLIGVAGIYNFSAILFAGLFLFLPPEFAERLGQRFPIERLRGLAGAYRWVSRALLAVAALVLLSQLSWNFEGAATVTIRTLADSMSEQRSLISRVFEGVWWVYGVSLIAILLSVLRAGRFEWPSAKQLLRPQRAVMLIPVLLIFLNGASPYLGLKTETSFAMFSNLRTEGSEPNHLLMPAAFKLAGYQEDLVTIVRASDPALQRLAGSGYRLTFFEFRRQLGRLARNGAKPGSVVYRRGGVETTAEYPGAPLGDAPLVLRKLLSFRPVAPPEARSCSH